MHNTQLLTPEDAAAFLGVQTNTLAVWRCTKRVNLPFVKLGKRLIGQVTATAGHLFCSNMTT